MYRTIVALFLVTLSTLLAIGVPVSAFSDEPFPGINPGTGSVKVRVRTVRATDSLGEQSQAKVHDVKYSIDDSLRDISAKLQKLHYKSFRLVSNQQETVPLMKKQTMYLIEGNTLVVRPLYRDGSKVGLWLRWLDGGGTKVLDTRMHFHCGESMLTGTEGNEDSGLVLAIDVQPAE